MDISPLIKSIDSIWKALAVAIFAGPRCGAWLDFLCSQLQSPVQLRAHMHRFFLFSGHFGVREYLRLTPFRIL